MPNNPFILIQILWHNTLMGTFILNYLPPLLMKLWNACLCTQFRRRKVWEMDNTIVVQSFISKLKNNKKIITSIWFHNILFLNISIFSRTYLIKTLTKSQNHSTIQNEHNVMNIITWCCFSFGPMHKNKTWAPRCFTLLVMMNCLYI